MPGAQNLEILRKLSRCETHFDIELLKYNSVFLTRTFLVDFKSEVVDLRDLLLRACAYWVKRHPFLAAQIHRSDTERFFVKMSNPFRFDNVEFSETTNPDEWRSVMENEMNTRFDMSQGPLWRLKAIRIRSSQVDDEITKYAFVFTTQHSITDGRNAVEIFIQLMNILGNESRKTKYFCLFVVYQYTGALIENKLDKIEDDVVEESRFTLEQLAEASLDKDCELKPVISNLERTNRITSYFADPKAHPRSQFQCFNTPAHKFKKLLGQMKLNAPGAKLTSLLTTVICLAFKNLYNKYHVDDIPVSRFQFSLLGNLRAKLGLANTHMGVYIANYERKLIDSEENKLELSTVWKLSQEESKSLHQTIGQNQDLIGIVYADKFQEEIARSKPEMTYSDRVYNFKLSNIGQVSNVSSGIICMREHYVRTSNVHDRPDGNLFIGTSTVGETMCWSICYNERLIRTEIVKELVSEIETLIDAL